MNRDRFTFAALRCAAGMGVVALSACTFDAKNPGAITEPGLESPDAVVALVQGVVGDYDFAYHRSSLYSGIISDEIRVSGTYSSWKNADLNGVVDPKSTSTGVQNISHEWWSRLHRARVLAAEAHDQVEVVITGPEQKPLLALTRLYEGMAVRDLAEYFCAATYDAGPRVERAQSLEIAKQHLTESITLAQEAGVDSIVRMGRLMRAQVNVSLGKMDEALADARAVPAGFVWQAHYRQGGHESNETIMFMNEQGIATVQQEFWNTGDPRVPVKANGKGTDGVTLRYDQQKYQRYANMPMGKWQEARLIEAEIVLAGGDVPGAVALLNQVRAPAGLAPLATTLTAAQAQTALRNERKHELFLEGQRMLDLRRWGLLAEGWVSCIDIPASETGNNPNF